MADNYGTSGGSVGDQFASDDIGGTEFPRHKLIFGADGVNDGDVDNLLPLPVNSADRTDAMQDGNTQVTPKFLAINVASSGDNTLVAAVASKKIRVLSVVLMTGAAVTVRFESGAAGTALTGQMEIGANAGFSSGYCPVGHFETAVNTLLNLELSGAINVDGWLVYVEVA